MLNEGDLLDNRYEITGELGQGGMSYVYRAIDQHLDREVALKMLRPHLTDTDKERFRREIKALANLNHPGIVTIYDLGREEYIYFTMELVEGGMITDLGPLELDPEPLRNLLEAAITVAETLDYVHRLGMVHRDLTPRNILLTKTGFPKVMDFGLVQLAETTRELTKTGLTLGTPQYMAPEQAKGEPTGSHTDLYAFGAVLYKLLTGITPFDADNDQAILYQHVYGELAPLQQHNPAIPDALADLLELLLQKDFRKRPSSGQYVAESLRSVLTLYERSATHQRLGGTANLGTYPTGPIMPEKLKPVWQISLHEGPQWPAGLTAGQGFLFLGLRSEEILVLRPADGSVQAQFEAPDEVNSAPLFLRDKLIINSRDGSLYTLAWPSGQTLFADEDAHAVGLLPYGNNIIVSTRQSTLEHRSLAGDIHWRYTAESAATTAPILHNGQVCFVTQEGWVHCVDALTGKGKFKIELGSIVASPVAKDNVLLLPERHGDLHAFDMIERKVRWTYDLEGDVWASPVTWQNRVYAVSWSNTLHCISLTKGEDIWQADLAANVTATPILAAGVLYVATEMGQIYAFDALSGKSLFEDTVSMSPIQASPLVLDDTLIVASLDGTVRAYRTRQRS